MTVLSAVWRASKLTQSTDNAATDASQRAKHAPRCHSGRPLALRISVCVREAGMPSCLSVCAANTTPYEGDDCSPDGICCVENERKEDDGQERYITKVYK
jgi:hypothetical protein